jgi:hypothetical protein
MKATNQRKVRTYKCSDGVYIGAMKKAQKNKSTLTKEIEKFVTRYGKKSDSKQ